LLTCGKLDNIQRSARIGHRTRQKLDKARSGKYPANMQPRCKSSPRGQVARTFQDNSLRLGEDQVVLI